MKKTIERITSTAMLAVAFMLCTTSAWAVAKPVAVWNRDFPLTGNTDTRGNLTLNLNGNTSDGIITIRSSATGGVRINKSTANLAFVAAVVGIKTNSVDFSNNPAIMTARSNGNDNTVGLKIQSDGKFVPFHSTTKSYNNNGPQTSHKWPSGTGCGYFSFLYNAVSDYGSRGTYAYTTTKDSYNYVYGAASLVNQSTAVLYGLNVGGLYTASANSNIPNLSTAQIEYIAIFDSDNASSVTTVDDFKYWSLSDMTSAETISSAGGNITSGDRSSYGVNLNGGTVNVTDDTTIAALFVQQDTELVFADGATLTITGPIYVADNVADNKVTLTITSVATISGSQIFITAGNVFATSGAIVSSDASYSAAVTSTTVGLTAYSNEASVSGAVDWSSITWADGTWHDGSPTTLTLTDDATINFDNTCSIPSLTLTGAHTATFVYTKTPTIWDWICENSATYKIKIPATSTDWPLGSAWTVPNNGVTYILAGSADSGSLTSCSGLITVNGKLETTGYLNLSAENKIAATGELKVLDGRTKMTAGGNANGICGTLTIEPGATFENATTDGLNFGGSPTVNVYGTLDMASTRWTLGSATLNFYAGSTITGGHKDNGALDSNSVKTFNVLAKAGQDTVNLSATLRPRNAQTFNIAANVTVNCTGKDSNEYTNPISITGGGKFKIATGASFTSKVAFNVTSPATLELAGGTIAGAIQETGNLSVASGTYEPSFSSFTGPISVSGNGTVLTLASSQITASSGITVGTGSTLKIKVTDEVIATGFDASSKVSNSGGTVMFVNSSGTQITENVSQDGETLNPPVKIWRDGKWTEAVASGDNAKLYISQNSTLTVSEALSLGTVTVVKESAGNVTLTISGAGALTTGGWTIPAGVTVNTPTTMTISGDVSGDGVINVPANTTLAMDGVTCSTKVTVYGTLETSGAATLSGNNEVYDRGAINVASGKTTMSFRQQYLGGANSSAYVSIYSGAELEFSSNDPIYYNGFLIIHVKGTLTIEENKSIKLGTNTPLNVYPGGVIGGSGTIYPGGGDGQRPNSTIKMFASGGDSSALASISCAIETGANSNIATINVEDGMTLVCSGSLSGSKAITKQGLGTLDLTGTTPAIPITIDAGKVVASTDPANANFANMTINQNGTFTLKNVAWTGAPSRFSGSGTLELYSESASCKHTVTGVTFPGIVKLSNVNMHPASGSPYYQNNINPTSADMFAENIRPEFILDSDLTHLGDGYYRNNAEHPLRIKNLSGSGEFRGQWGTGEYKYVVETLQERNTTYDGTLGCDASGSNPRCVSLSVIGSTQSEIHSLTITRPINGNEDIGCQTSTLKVSDYGKVVFSSTGSWGNGVVQVGANGVLESQHDANVATKLVLDAGSVLAFGASSQKIQASGALTPPVSGKVTVDVSNLTIAANASKDLLTVGSGMNVNKFSQVGNTETHVLSTSGQTLSLVPIAATVTKSTGTVSYAKLNEAVMELYTNRVPEPDAYVTLVNASSSDLDFSAEDLANAGIVYDESDGTYGFAAAEISSTKYTTVAKAIAAAASSGDTVTLLRNTSVQNISLAGKSITLDEDGNTFSGSFTGSGTLILGAPLAAADPARWAEGWTGTVWLQNLSDVTIVPANYGNADSVIKFTGVSGQIAAGTICSPAVELEDDGDTKALTLNSYSTTTASTITFNEFRGSGTFATVGGTADAYPRTNFRILKWDDFVGSLDVDRGRAVFGTDTISNDDWRYIYISEDADVTIAAGKSFTATQGLRVYGELTVESNNALSSKAVQGSGTIIYEVAPNNGTTKPSFHATLWTGVVEFQEFAAAGIKLAEYGTSNSKIKINGITSGHLMWEDQNVQAEVVLAGDVNITATSHRNYIYAHISGTGSFSVSNSNTSDADPNRLTITKLDVASGSVGMAVTNNTSTTLNIGTLALPEGSSVAPGAKLLKIGGTGNFSVGSVTVGGVTQSELQLAYVANDGVYVACASYGGNGYISVAAAIDAAVAAGGDVSTITILDGSTTLPAGYAQYYIDNGTIFKYQAAKVTPPSAEPTYYKTLAAAVAEADNNSYIELLSSGGEAEAAPTMGDIYIKPNGFAFTIVSAKAGYGNYVQGVLMPGLDGTYVYSPERHAATFVWKSNLASGNWNDKDNWTSTDGTVTEAPNNRIYDVKFATDATVILESGVTVNTIEVDANVRFEFSPKLSAEITATDVVMTTKSSMITLCSNGTNYVTLSCTPEASLGGGAKVVSETVDKNTIYKVVYGTTFTVY